MTDTTQTLTLEESIRRRPLLYLGTDVAELLSRIIIDCIEQCKASEITFEITLSDDNNFTVGFTSQNDLKPFIQRFTVESENFSDYFPIAFKIVTRAFEVITNGDAKTQIIFSFDKTLISDTNVDYLKLSEKMLQVALLNSKCEIITIDKRQKYLNQNYYRFPQGIFYLFDRAIAEALGKPEFELRFDGKVDSNTYQIGLAYRTDWYPVPHILSFANDVQTIYGGSLVDGILDGLISASKTYIKEYNLTTYKVTRRKLFNGLILVCAVRGEDYEYGGSFKESLESDEVKSEVKKLISKLALDYFQNQKEKADKFLWRFDSTQITSKLF